MAQSNAAWIADRGLIGSGGGSGDGSSSSAGAGGVVKDDAERYRLALRYYTLSAQQSNAGSLLKLADYSYYGLGTAVDYEEAAGYYMQASEMRNAQAYFNLGFMHHFGHGLPLDYHLARRFYDLTMSVSETPATQAPVVLAIYSLNLAIWWGGAKHSFPTFVVEAVEGAVAAMGIGHALPPPVDVFGTDGSETAGGGGGKGGGDGGASGGTAAGAGVGGGGDNGGDDEAALRADGLWKSWSSFVADTMGLWNHYTEAVRLALDPVTLRATFGSPVELLMGDAGGLGDSDTLVLVMLCTLLSFVMYRRWRQA